MVTESRESHNKTIMKELVVAQRAAVNAGKMLLKSFNKPHHITTKTTVTDLVTECDINAQKIILDELTKQFPRHNFIGEENLSKNQSSLYTWYIDPLDGTVSFAHGYPLFSVSIGLKKGNEPILGVVYVPELNELFYAAKGKGAYMNKKLHKKRIHVSTTAQLQQSLVASGFPYHKHINPDNNITEFCKVIVKIQGFRRSGSAAFDLCSVACGRLDGYWELFLKPWDYVTSAVIVEEAGGVVTNTDGTPLDYNGSRIVATNGKIHKQLLQALQ